MFMSDKDNFVAMLKDHNYEIATVEEGEAKTEFPTADTCVIVSDTGCWVWVVHQSGCLILPANS